MNVPCTDLNDCKDENCACRTCGDDFCKRITTECVPVQLGCDFAACWKPQSNEPKDWEDDLLP